MSIDQFGQNVNWSKRVSWSIKQQIVLHSFSREFY